MQMDIKEQDQMYIAHTYHRFDAVLTKGSHCIAMDADGKSYLDMTAGIGVNALGYADKEWAKAVSEQANTLPHVSNYIIHNQMVMLPRCYVSEPALKK